MSGDSGVALDVVSLEIELTEAVPPTFVGSTFTPSWSAGWSAGTGLVVDVGDVTPGNQGIKGSEVTGIQLTFGVVPEPVSIAMLSAGCAVSLVRRRRRQ